MMIDLISFTLISSASFALTMGVGWSLVKLSELLRSRSNARPYSTDLPAKLGEIHRGRGMLGRVFADLRPYSWSIFVVLIISLSAIPITLITSLPMLGAMIVVTLYLDWELALIALLVSPFMFLLTLIFRPRLRRGWRKFKTSESAAMAVAQEALGASRVVKAFGQEEQKNEQLVSHYNDSLAAQLKVYFDGAVYNLLVGIVTAAGLAAVLYIGIHHVESNPPTLTLGNLLVVNYYITQLYTPLRNVGQKILDIQMSLTGIERYHAVLDEKPDVPETPNALPLARAKGKITFQNVSFEYTKSRPVLHDLSFELLPGSCLGVVGPTGSGKTTLSSLVLRFFDPTQGAITLDDVDLRNYKLADLRNQFAVVHQDTVLFSTTITENIRF